MLPDRVSNPGPLIYESGALPIALRGPANGCIVIILLVVKQELYIVTWRSHLICLRHKKA